jgi:hypothetical protein
VWQIKLNLLTQSYARMRNYEMECHRTVRTVRSLVVGWEHRYSCSTLLLLFLLLLFLCWYCCCCCCVCVQVLSPWFLAQLIFRPWRWRRYVPPKRRLTLNGLHGVICQKMVLFITAAVRTSNSWRLLSRDLPTPCQNISLCMARSCYIAAHALVPWRPLCFVTER